MLKVKVCGMKDPVNTGEISALQVDFIGFIFYPGSPRYVGAAPDKDMFSGVPERISKTGVFVDAEPAHIIETVRLFSLDLVQLHGKESPQFCRQLRREGIKIIKAFELDSAGAFQKMEEYTDAADYFLFDTKTGTGGGSGVKFNWSVIEGYTIDKPFFLSGGIGPGDIRQIRQIDNKNLYGVDINSRFEIGYGIKEKEKIEAFIKEIKSRKDELRS